MLSSLQKTFPLASSTLHFGFNSLVYRTGLASLLGLPDLRKEDDFYTFGNATPENFAVFAQLYNLIVMSINICQNSMTQLELRSCNLRGEDAVTLLSTAKMLMDIIRYQAMYVSQKNLQPSKSLFTDATYRFHKEKRLYIALYCIDYPWSFCAKVLWIVGNIALAVASIPLAVFAAFGDLGNLCVAQWSKKSEIDQLTIDDEDLQSHSNRLQQNPSQRQRQIVQDPNALTSELRAQIEQLQCDLDTVDWAKVFQRNPQDFQYKRVLQDVQNLLSPNYPGLLDTDSTTGQQTLLGRSGAYALIAGHVQGLPRKVSAPRYNH